MGVVRGPDGTIVAEAPIRVRNKASGIDARTFSSTDGHYDVQDLPNGTFSVTIQMPCCAFAPYRNDEVVLDAGETLEFNIRLEEGALNRTGFLGDLITWEDGVMGRPSRFSPEVRERAVRMVEEHREAHASEWAVLQSVAPKLGCTAETLRKWVRQAQRDAGHRPGLTTSERERLKELEREVRELKRANEILRKASAYFAQAELDRRGK